MNAIAEPAAMQSGDFRRLPVKRLAPSPSNAERAKNYDAAKLQELADSIKANGLAQPILVTPALPGGKDYDHVIVAGERRWRAHQLAGLSEIDCIVRELTPMQVLELQLIENLQRQDVHPLQEADGYRVLLDLHGLSMDALAKRIGKSTSYIFARLKLRDLCADVRKEYYAGKFGSEIALLLARIPTKDLQTRACKEITSTHYGDGVMSFRQARDHIERNYMLRLAEAPFDTKDAKLVATAGACTDCPKRTGNQRDLFADIKGADVCTDPTCFAGKKDAAAAARIAEAKAAGQRVITGAEAKKVKPSQYGGLQGVVAVDKVSYDLGHKTPKEALGKALPPTALLKDPHSGELVEVVDAAALRKAAKDKGLIKTASRTSSTAARRGHGDEKAERQARVRRAVWMRVRDKIRAKPTAGDLQMVAKSMWSDVWSDEVAKLWGFGPSAGDLKKIEAAIDKLSAIDLAVLVCDLALEESAGGYDSPSSDRLMAAAKRHRVDVDAIKKEIEAEARAKKATPAKKGAKK